MKRCASPLTIEIVRRYFAADLDADASLELEDHLFECNECAAAFDREGAIAAGLRAFIPHVISHERLARLERAGLTVKKCVIEPGRTVDVLFTAKLSLLVNALSVDADDADCIDLTIADPSGRPVVEMPAVPYDRGSGEVLIACQRHYRELLPSPLARFELTAVKGAERRSIGTYLVNHSWES